MHIPCTRYQFYTACHEIGLDVVGDTVHIPTDLETPLYITVADVENGIEITNVANTHIVNMLAIIQERLGIPATFIPNNESPIPLSHHTDMYYGDIENYPYLMFKMIPWLNNEIEDNDVERVYAMCDDRHALMLLARMVGFGKRLRSLDRLFEIIQAGTTPQCERLILHIVAAHTLTDDDMLRWSEWSEGHGLQDILFRRRDPETYTCTCSNGPSVPETKTQPPPPTEYILFRGLMTCVRYMARPTRQRVEDVLRMCKIPFERHEDWKIVTPTLRIFFHQRLMGFTIICVEPRYDDEVSLTRVWKQLRRITL